MIVFALSCIAYIMVTFFATYAYFTFRGQRKEISFIKGAVREMSMMMLAKRVKENFEEVEKMKGRFRCLSARSSMRKRNALKNSSKKPRRLRRSR